jgi:uracil-DNA glycosylase family 4
MDFSSCEGCSLSKVVSHVGLPAVGNPQSEFFVISDRPGYKEDNLGVSFSGRPGQFLVLSNLPNQMLSSRQ